MYIWYVCTAVTNALNPIPPHRPCLARTGCNCFRKYFDELHTLKRLMCYISAYYYVLYLISTLYVLLICRTSSYKNERSTINMVNRVSNVYKKYIYTGV